MSGPWPVSGACPWCGEAMEVLLDGPADTAERVEDCAVCCQPVVVRIEASPGEDPRVVLSREGR